MLADVGTFRDHVLLENPVKHEVREEGAQAEHDQPNKALRLTAQDLQKLGVIDRIVKEPIGGAQRGRKETIEAVGKAIETMLKELSGKKPETLIKDRRQKFIDMGSKGLAA